MPPDAAITSSMNDLDNDCLRRILLYVPVYDRIKLRKVCKRFRAISDDCWRTVRELAIVDIHMIPSLEYDYGTENTRTEEEYMEIEKGFSGIYNCIWLKTSNQKLIEGVMKRCGEFLTDIIDFREERNDSTLSLALKYCRKLEKLSMSVSSKADDKLVNQLLAVNKKIKVLDLEISLKNVKVCFRTIPTEFLVRLRIDSYSSRPPPSILMTQKQIVRKARFLKRLDFNTFDDELVEIIGKKSQLEVLNLETVNADYLTKTGLNPILHLKNLRQLSIRFPDGCRSVCLHDITRAPMGDDYVTTLAENLRLLEKLTLEAPAGVTDKSFVKLASLPKLRHLTIECCKGITDKFLFLFDNIEILGVIECDVHDEGVIKLLEVSQTIRQLNLEDTYITNKSLAAAVQATKKRDNGLGLIFFVSNTKTKPEKLSESSPLLKIVKRKKTGTRFHDI